MALNRKENRMSRYFFLHASSGDSWEAPDPIPWCLEDPHEPILERGREGLLDRIIRLVTRRCNLT
jgi:hypothetical protein